MNNTNPTNTTDHENMNGREPFPETIIVSSERSGHNLVRYLVEHMGGQRTSGPMQKFETGPLLFHRTHCVHSSNIGRGRTNIYDMSNKPKYSKMILLLRDPRETFVRAYDKQLPRMLSYCWNIIEFDRFTGSKLLVYYDDLITKNSIIEEIFKFLDIGHMYDESKVDGFRKESVNWYEINQAGKGKGSITKGSPELMTYHQQSLAQDDMRKLLELLKTELGVRYCYLSRWGI